MAGWLKITKNDFFFLSESLFKMNMINLPRRCRVLILSFLSKHKDLLAAKLSCSKLNLPEVETLLTMAKRVILKNIIPEKRDDYERLLIETGFTSLEANKLELTWFIRNPDLWGRKSYDSSYVEFMSKVDEDLKKITREYEIGTYHSFDQFEDTYTIYFTLEADPEEDFNEHSPVS
jgi:hypothetical protein